MAKLTQFVLFVIGLTAVNAAARPISPLAIASLTGLSGGFSRGGFGGGRPSAPKVVAAPVSSSSGGVYAILRQNQDINPDGSYVWEYQTDNGISAQEQGSVKSAGPEGILAAAGSYAWTSPEGEQISITYIADENGYQPQGSHLPVAPPIPEAILKSIAWNEAHPEK